MTDKQPKALRLADEFEICEWIDATGQWREEAAAELRRLHEVNQELSEALNLMFASIIPYQHDGTPTIPDATVDKANAAIAKAGEQP